MPQVDAFYRESRPGVNVTKYNIMTGLFGLPRWYHRGKDYLLSIQSICVSLPRYSAEIIVEKINICVLNTI